MTVAGATALSVETSTNVPTPAVAGDARHHARGERVVAHRLDRVGLHQPDVLVGGGVEDDRRAVLGEHLAHPLLLLAVRQHRDGVERVAVLHQLALDLEQVVLGVVEQDEPARPDARDLAAQLGADRAARAGDEHARGRSGTRRRARPPSAPARARARPRPGPRAPGASAGRRSAAARRRSASCARARRARGRRRRPARAACPAPTGSRSAPPPARRRRARGRARSVVPSTSSPRSTRAPLLARVVVDEADRAVAELGVAQDLAQQQPPAVAGADDQHRARVLARREAAQRALVDRRARRSARRRGRRA